MELIAQKRQRFGRQTKALRSEGLIPAELYGHGIENLHLKVKEKDFNQVFSMAGESTLIDLVVEDKKYPVLIHEVSLDPVSDNIVAIDFYQVRLDEKITTNIPLVFIGESLAVKQKGGILVRATSEIEIKALPGQIPRDIKVDISKLDDIGQSIHIKELPIPEGVELSADLETVVATITAKMTEEEEQKLTQEADLSAIKTETEDKQKDKEEESPEPSSVNNPQTKPEAK